LVEVLSDFFSTELSLWLTAIVALRVARGEVTDDMVIHVAINFILHPNKSNIINKI
jgi:hypothetical protein